MLVPVPSAPGLKICGVTHPDDIDACLTHGVTAIGLNLWPGSKRGLTLEQAEPLARRARERRAGHRPLLVGVFVDATASDIHHAFETLCLDLVQPHDDTPIDRTAALGLPYVWVIRGTPPLDALRPPTPAPTWILLDAHVPGYGGQAVTTDWTWAAAAVRALAPLPVWLAGGITPDNGAEALALVAPAGLDVASGAERPGDPRRKDPAAIAALASICKNHDEAP
jgi:phosphoribosylanthranilate isomerase